MQSYRRKESRLDKQRSIYPMKNVLLIGVGRFGRHIAMQLSQLGHQVMAVDTDEERINDVLPFVTNA